MHSHAERGNEEAKHAKFGGDALSSAPLRAVPVSWRVFTRLVAICAGTSAAVVMGQPAPADPAGVYTEEQAVRGQALYYQHCLNCHGETMGGVDKAPALAGPQFSGVWGGEPLSALVARLNTMPPDKPGSLSRAENVDLLAYMLWYNGLPIGQKPLGTEQEVLEQIKFQAPMAGQ